MYATTQQQQHSMYGGSPYHWDQHPLRGKVVLHFASKRK